ncbi:hypothetical protein GOQ30_09960 [Flavobacterium sp. TP390]|uniref:DUF4595 domain-containing protein n=1 Tax=Flavobacterium profundi TaxID=1774945 RepID=A0A6I4ILS9_9FLAO|nr:hypothetical protein [Flavobacterium profundi]MVO09481.1 hypothetical protein [Flavobacterium profundi]
MKNIISSLLLVSLFALVACSKNDDDATINDVTIRNPKKVILNTYSNQGNLTNTVLYEFSYNEKSLLSTVKITDVDGVKNRTINYNSEDRISQITQTSGNNAKILTVTYTGENATLSISGETNPYLFTYSSSNNSYDYSNGTDNGTFFFGENDNLIEIISENASIFSKSVTTEIKGIYANQNKLTAFFFSFLNNGEFLFFDRNAMSTLSFDGVNYIINNESENGSLTYYNMINATTQIKIVDVIIIY